MSDSGWANNPPRTLRSRGAWLGAIGALGCALSVASPLTPAGIAFAVAIPLVWYALPAPYVIAVAHLGLPVILPDAGLEALLALEGGVGVGAPAVTVLGLEAGLLVILAGSVVDRQFAGRSLLALLVAVAVLAGSAVAGGLITGQVWGGGVAVVTVGAVAIYGLHRLELVSLRLVPAETARRDRTGGDSGS